MTHGYIIAVLSILSLRKISENPYVSRLTAIVYHVCSDKTLRSYSFHSYSRGYFKKDLSR
ncbi:hypothetical protein CHCC14525_0159 [Bacillus licheniformis]|nr:hypothetical protein CHCC14596_1322 [Bacillus licheniformis]TWN34115.1 hypothetical protein CHCC14525_0159 [Bacillus licheniformis]